MASAPDQIIHASCIALSGRGILLMGPSGSGKSDLALRLIDRGAALVSDDYTALHVHEGRLIANPPGTIAGKLEIRHIGIVDVDHAANMPIALAVQLEERPERMPDLPAHLDLFGCTVPLVCLAGLEPSAPIKLEIALDRFGLGGPSS